jgi:2-oxoisovalerate dehydrogenase E1 component beta subunit
VFIEPMSLAHAPRLPVPLDADPTPIGAARPARRGRDVTLATAHEAWVTGGIGAEVTAAVAEARPAVLRAPVVRVGAAPVPTPSGKVRPHALPSLEHILAAIQRVLELTAQ